MTRHRRAEHTAIIGGHAYRTLPGLVALLGPDLNLPVLLRDWARRGLLDTGNPAVPGVVEVDRRNWYLVAVVIEAEYRTRDATKRRRSAALTP